jgi:hypothetical protein
MGHRAYDLLILPFGLHEALTRLLHTRFRASCVLLLEMLDEPWERAAPLIDALRAQVQAAAVPFIRPPESGVGSAAGAVAAGSFYAAQVIVLLHSGARNLLRHVCILLSEMGGLNPSTRRSEFNAPNY